MVSHYVQKFPIPDGFQDILHDFSREVLRDQPENLYYYGYLYFQAMEQGMDFHYEATKKKLSDHKVSEEFQKQQQKAENSNKAAPNHHHEEKHRKQSDDQEEEEE